VLHEIKHDRFRILARRDAKGVRLITRNGNDFSKRFSPGRGGDRNSASCLIDGEPIVSDEAGLAVFRVEPVVAPRPRGRALRLRFVGA
jgi:bifunctional non-homologous end joining protein LigD